MANRFLLKEFAKNASNTGVFGSYSNGSPTYSEDPEQIQSLPAWLEGWLPAVTSGTLLPRLEEMQGLQKVICQAISENYREGVPEWLDGEAYYKNSVVSYADDSHPFMIYYNTTGDYNSTNPAEDTQNWASFSSLFGTDNLDYIKTNAVSNGLWSAQDSSSFSSFTGAYYNNGCTVAGDNVSGFGKAANLVLTKSFPTGVNWLVSGTFTAGDDLVTQQPILSMPTLDSSFGIMNNKVYLSLWGYLKEGTTLLDSGTLYYYNLKFDGSQYTFEISTNNVNYNSECVYETTDQPFAGKTITLGWGGADYPNNYFQGSIGFPTITSGGASYWTSTTSSAVNLIHFDGTYNITAPNGRNTDGTLNNMNFEQTLNSFMLYTPVNGTKTILVTNEGELMARNNYTESNTAPAGNLMDVWYNSDTNVMYQFGAQQPNFTNNGATVTDGVVSAFGSVELPVQVTPDNVGNQFEVNITTGSNINTAQQIAKLGNTRLYLANGMITWDIPVTSYQVGISNQDPESPTFENIGYVPVNGSSFLASGTQIYSDVTCEKKLAVATGADYEYTSVQENATLTLIVPAGSKATYQVGTIYLAGNYMLNIGGTWQERITDVKPQNFDPSNIVLGGTDTSYSTQLSAFTGTIDLAHTGFEGWTWNGVSTSSNAWNRFVGAKIGTVTDNGTNITSLTIDKPIELVKTTDLIPFKNEVNSNINNLDSRITDIMDNLITFNKSNNGYIKIKDIIINYGYLTYAQASNTITFAAPFSNNNYGFGGTILSTYGSGAYMAFTNISNKSSTNFTINKNSVQNNGFSWVAIGY